MIGMEVLKGTIIWKDIKDITRKLPLNEIGIQNEDNTVPIYSLCLQS